MLRMRCITSLILIPIIIGALFCLPILAFSITIFLISMLAAWEWCPLAGLSSCCHRVFFIILCGFILSISMFDILFGNALEWIHWLRIPDILWIAVWWWILVIPLVLFYPSSAVLWRTSRILGILFGLLTIWSFFCGMLTVRQYHYQLDHTVGAWRLLYLLILVWGIDSGAYLFGKVFGKHQLVPKISSGKTWEGLLGGLLSAFIIFFIFTQLTVLGVAPISLFLCSIFTVFASILGDLSESIFKRTAGIKDSGKLIPGHGGILDRIDSLTAAAPIFASLQLVITEVI
ncbi:phosphatidate cytidylyltransferase [Candidatus Erwinia haradaeae]|uniref:Phosphatidate cytidylyltransferase n=1 Tax=Candidatus Erwinia haradaeae TaxID=1922217 RepID=A0A451D3R2_9GAMM|nr:phosphatidate cytidylyltransferase [Candidatus Erwinia haradaeae]VFP80309.1 Phosphatidate cytidylyltransferase [Candidatus Erwinia haradaeae]